jgi:hypothetical protein
VTFAPYLKWQRAWKIEVAVVVSVALAVVATTTTVAATTMVGEKWFGIVRMLLKHLLTLPEPKALGIIGRKPQETLNCVVRRRTLLLVVLGSPLVTNL